MWIWCWRGSPEQKKCFALSLSSICVSSLDVWRLWITWFYRLINGGDFRQRLLEHETQSRARKSPDVDIDQSVRYSQHIDLSAWSDIFTWRFWPNLLRGYYVCSIGWFSDIVSDGQIHIIILLSRIPYSIQSICHGTFPVYPHFAFDNTLAVNLFCFVFSFAFCLFFTLPVEAGRLLLRLLS